MAPVPERDAQQRALLAAIAADEAQDARLFARRMRCRAEMDRLWNDGEAGPEQFGMIELAGTARIGQLRADNQLSTARRLVDLFGATLALLEAGVMFQQTAVLLLELTRCCTDEVQAELERRVLTQIATANTTDVRRLITTMILEVEADLGPDLTRERLARAHRDRRVWTVPMPDGMTHITASLDVITARRWVLDFEELVRAQKIIDRKNGVVRTQQQRRADLFAKLPAGLLALIQGIQQGHTAELLAVAEQDPQVAEQLEALAATAPTGPTGPTLADTADTTDTTDEAAAADAAPGQAPTEAAPAPAELSVGELSVGLLGLPVRDPRVLNVHIPMSTLLDLDHRSGHLEGHGPIPAEQARLMAPVTGLRRLFVDALSGVPVGIDPVVQPPLDHSGAVTAEQLRERLLAMLGPTTVVQRAEPRHDPSRALTRLVEIRDQGCIGIGCSCPAHRTDNDHDLRYPDGPTALWNLSSKSRRCHRAKHAGWTVTRYDRGQVRWTSPLGHSYTRPGVWQAPPPLPPDVTLPPARLPQFDDHDPWPLDRPLWTEPEAQPPDTTTPRLGRRLGREQPALLGPGRRKAPHRGNFTAETAKVSPGVVSPPRGRVGPRRPNPVRCVAPPHAACGVPKPLRGARP